MIKHFEGICHVYIDSEADLKKAKRITLNSKLLMPEVCNAMETLLISDKIHARGPMGLEELTTYKFVIRGEDHIKR